MPQIKYSNPESLSLGERNLALKLARQALEEWVHTNSLSKLELDRIPLRLRQIGATFVTLTINEQLRGCVGALEATLPLAEDVRQHAVAAACQDYRFSPVQIDELPLISIEVSCLTPLIKVDYESSNDLIKKLRPEIDGVVLKDGARRATFLPQVWVKIPDPKLFLDLLCEKLGAPAQYWRQKNLDVYTYQVEIFRESRMA